MTLGIQERLLEIRRQEERENLRRWLEERGYELPPWARPPEPRPLNLPWPLTPEDLED